MSIRSIHLMHPFYTISIEFQYILIVYIVCSSIFVFSCYPRDQKQRRRNQLRLRMDASRPLERGGVRHVVHRVRMTSPYFMQGRSVITRSGNQTTGCTPAAFLRSGLTSRRRNVEPVPSVAVKVEVEEASVSELRPSSAPLSTGNNTVRLQPVLM